MAKKIIYLFTILTVSLLLQAVNSSAVELQSPRFRLEVGDLKIDESEKKFNFYTLEELYGQDALSQFKSQGYFIRQDLASKPIAFSLNPAVISDSDFSSKAKYSNFVGYSLSAAPDKVVFLNLIQEYPLKNLVGDTLDLFYALKAGGNFQSLANQNTGRFPIEVSSGLGQASGKIYFGLDPLTPLNEGSFETVIDYTATTGY